MHALHTYTEIYARCHMKKIKQMPIASCYEIEMHLEMLACFQKYKELTVNCLISLLRLCFSIFVAESLVQLGILDLLRLLLNLVTLLIYYPFHSLKN